MKQENWNLYSEQNNAIPHFLQQCEQQWMQLNSVNANNFHTLMEMKYIPCSSIKELELLRLHANLLHVPYHQSCWIYSSLTFRTVMLTYVHVTVAVLNVELCNSVSISMIWQHKISVNHWMEYHKMYWNSKNFIWWMSHRIKIIFH